MTKPRRRGDLWAVDADKGGIEYSEPSFSCGNIRKAVERLLFKTIEIRSESVPMALEQA